MANITARKELNLLAERETKHTHFTLLEVQALLTEYQKKIKNSKNPTKMDRYVFQDILHNDFQITDPYIMDTIFKVMDTDNDNFLSREEWVRGMSVYLKGTFDQHIDTCFKCFDTNGDGYISRDEMQRFLKDALIHQSSEEDQDEQLKELTDLVLKLMDFDKDGRLSPGDYKEAVMKERLLLEALGPIFPQEKYQTQFMERIIEDYNKVNTHS